ncbi:hypothetical protein F7725_004225 [Dissostichus mawsoni]|uniref:Uncharacterized protein n=1 Tax=Dissostichus mawsoni TaxID=36200 RepID=A0A7J5XIK2_DISMA|nr:hypothetical protein F7725_004225 [Dissostichus mawsoni]
MASNTIRSLETEKRPSAVERREVVRIVVAEIFSVCKKPGKKHFGEIARKMVIQYPKSFRDEIEGQVVGTGYDSLTKQMLSRIDNYRWLQSPLQKGNLKVQLMMQRKGVKIHTAASILSQSFLLVKLTQCKSRNRKSSRGCLTKIPGMQRQLKDLWLRRFIHRGETLSSKEMEDLVKEWPFLFQENGIRLHFRELTGVDITLNFDESTETKFKRILRYFQFQQSDPTNTAEAVLSQTLAGGDETGAAVLMLLAHFREKQEKMLEAVDDTAIASEVDVKKLPSTPCIVACGNSPLTAKTFMVAVDQVIVNEQLPTFTKALQFMFCSYYFCLP